MRSLLLLALVALVAASMVMTGVQAQDQQVDEAAMEFISEDSYALIEEADSSLSQDQPVNEYDDEELMETQSLVAPIIDNTGDAHFLPKANLTQFKVKPVIDESLVHDAELAAEFAPSPVVGLANPNVVSEEAIAAAVAQMRNQAAELAAVQATSIAAAQGATGQAASAAAGAAAAGAAAAQVQVGGAPVDTNAISAQIAEEARLAADEAMVAPAVEADEINEPFQPLLVGAGVGSACSSGSRRGVCQVTTSTCSGGTYVSNLCPNSPSNVRCCLSNAASTSTPAASTSRRYTYSQSTGRFTFDDGTVAPCYSGRVAGTINTPSRQHVQSPCQGSSPACMTSPAGPIPQGTYTVTTRGSASFGPNAWRLAPAASNNMFGRGGFLIHAASASKDAGGQRRSSAGCIIMGPTFRSKIRSGMTLVVTA